MSAAAENLKKLSTLLVVSAEALKEMTKIEGIDGKVYDVFELSFELLSLAERVKTIGLLLDVDTRLSTDKRQD